MHRVVHVKPLEDLKLEIRFDDGICGVVSLRDRLRGPVFEPLFDPSFFRKVYIDDFGAVAWPNGADLAPDALYERLRAASTAA